MKRISLLILLIAAALQLSAQKGGELIFTVGGDSVWGAEFERVYSKNNKVDQKKPTLEELEEYRDLYVKFKLKVKEAYRLQMDTNPSYVKELAGYRRQLAQPYLTDQEVTETLMKEAYDRLGQEVRGSNLMVHVNLSAPPADTLAAYNRIKNWQKMLAEGADFNQLAQDSSTDQSARKNRGDLGYFTAFNMIYPFENQAFNTPRGGVSEIFRTQYGYHLLKVNDKRASRGELRVAHILIRINNETEYDEKKERIEAIYKLLQGGSTWDDMVQQHTEDFGSRNRGGELNWIKSVGGGIPQEFKEVAFGLKNDGDYSAPVKTELGWHIIKRLEHRPIKSYDELTQWLKFKINKDQRGKLNKEVMLGKLKKANNFTEFPANLDWVKANMDTTVLDAAWFPSEAFTSNTNPIFTLGDSSYTVARFAHYMGELQINYGATSVENFVGSAYVRFVEEMNFVYEESMLEVKYPDFHYLMQEYRDGILLFELTNNMVWNKATVDTTGLQEFFTANQKNYMWKERLVATKYTCSEPSVYKKLKKAVAKGKSPEYIKEKFNEENVLAVKIESVLAEKGSVKEYDAVEWKPGIVEISDDSKNQVFLDIKEIKPVTEKKMKETLGTVISDYQDHLEKEWIAELRERYPVTINEGALRTLFQ